MKKGLVLAALVFAGAVSLQAQNLKSSVYVTGLSLPLLMVQDPTDATRQFVLQQRGLIRTIQNGALSGTNAISLTGVVSSAGSEKGLLGMAFPPNYATSGIAYVHYTTGNTSASTISWVSKITRNVINPATFDIASLDPILTLNQPFTNHNGGTIRFGPDGFLYIGFGDGGSGGDPGDRAQNITDLLGKMLRIDPSSDAFPGDANKDYAIPAGQPFGGAFGTLAPEIWSVGLRNPWKFTFDTPGFLGTGALIIADVGQGAWEEINYEPANSGPRNYGWRRREGYANFTSSGGPWTENRDPIWVYDHGVGISITGGYVYRGLNITDSFGRYFFADYGSARIWSLRLTLNGAGEAQNAVAADVTEVTNDILTGAGSISSIDVDANGELYFVDYGGGRVVKLEPEDRAWPVYVNYAAAIPLSGQIRSLAAADNKNLTYANDWSADTFDGDAGVLRVGFAHNRASPSTVQVTLVARTNQSVGHTGRIALRNWNTRRLDVIQDVGLSLTSQTFNTSAIAASNYIRSSDGRIEVALLGTSALTLVDPVTTFVDQIRVAVN